MKITLPLLSESAIPLSLYKKWKGHDQFNRERYSELFRKYEGDKHAYRIYLPILGSAGIAKKVVIPTEIVQALELKGYVADDYRAGIAVDVKTGKRKIRIGKLLSDSPELLKLFNNDSQRTASKLATAKLLVVISRHPYDIAGMSTGRGWRSCTSLIDGVNRKYVVQDVKHGTLIAYLIKADDKNIESPIARVRLYRFNRKPVKAPKVKGPKSVQPAAPAPISEDDYIFVREPRIYGAPSPQFTAVIDGWLAEVNAGKADGLYCAPSGVYKDDVDSTLTRLSDPSSVLTMLEKGQKLPKSVHLTPEGKAKVAHLLKTKIASFKSRDQAYEFFEANHLSTLMELCIPPEDAGKFAKLLLNNRNALVVGEEWSLPFDIAASMWHGGIGIPELKKLGLTEDAIDVDDEQVGAYLPGDIDSDTLLLSFFLAVSNKRTYFRYSATFFETVFSGGPVALESQYKTLVRPAWLREAVDDWLQGVDNNSDYEESRSVIKRIQNMFQTFGLPIDKASKSLILEYGLNTKALREQDLISEKEAWDNLIEQAEEGSINIDQALKEAGDSPEFRKALKDKMFQDAEYLVNNYLEDPAFVRLLDNDDLKKVFEAADKDGSPIDPRSLPRLTKTNKALDVTPYQTTEQVLKFLVSRAFRNWKRSEVNALKRQTNAEPGSLLALLLAEGLKVVKA